MEEVHIMYEIIRTFDCHLGWIAVVVFVEMISIDLGSDKIYILYADCNSKK
jgi:hypothetical protein